MKQEETTMAEEHEHEWAIGATAVGEDEVLRGPWTRLCTTCKLEETVSEQWVYHWLTDIAAKHIEALEHQLAEAKGLLSMLASDEAEPVFALSEEQHDGYECLRCDTYVYHYEPDHFPHAPECPWLLARKLLGIE
jgi:hypothetical protein